MFQDSPALTRVSNAAGSSTETQATIYSRVQQAFPQPNEIPVPTNYNFFLSLITIIVIYSKRAHMWCNQCGNGSVCKVSPATVTPLRLQAAAGHAHCRNLRRIPVLVPEDPGLLRTLVLSLERVKGVWFPPFTSVNSAASCMKKISFSDPSCNPCLQMCFG